ncbi:MAG TPA: hypothetical protein DCM38_05990 [Gammaproteobacteria bacterium]|nr:transposase [Candidatus Parabeggiatoa sp.]HAI68973.1 hypothetical protein [Gammaproteobacteria bacterium]
MLVENSLAGYRELEQWIRKELEELPQEFAAPYLQGQKQIPFVAESTGPYSQTFFRLMDGLHSIFLPYMINAGMQDKKNRKARIKTDKSDAIELAVKGRTGSLVGFHPFKFLPIEVEALRSMTRFRTALIKERTGWYQRLSTNLVYNGVTLSTSYERSKKDTPFTERSGFWHSKAGVNLLYHLVGLNGEVTKSDLHDLGEYAGLSPSESEIHLNGFLKLPSVIAENVIYATLTHTSTLDEQISHLDKQIERHFHEHYPKEYDITLSCPSFGTVSGAVIFSESGTAECLRQRFKDVEQYLRFAQLGIGKVITGGKLIGVVSPPGNRRLGSIYRLLARAVMRTKDPDYEEIQKWTNSLRHRTNYLKSISALSRRVAKMWYFAMIKGELCSFDKYDFEAVRATRNKEIVKAVDIVNGINFQDEMTQEEALQLGRLVDVVSKRMGQNLVYVINPEYRKVVSTMGVEEVFNDSKSEKSIAYHLKKGGIHTVDILVGKVITGTLLMIPQIGKVNQDKIVSKLLEKQYIFNIATKASEGKRIETECEKRLEGIKDVPY